MRAPLGIPIRRKCRSETPIRVCVGKGPGLGQNTPISKALKAPAGDLPLTQLSQPDLQTGVCTKQALAITEHFGGKTN